MNKNIQATTRLIITASDGAGLAGFIASAVTERSCVFGNQRYGLCWCSAAYIRKKRFIFSGV